MIVARFNQRITLAGILLMLICNVSSSHNQELVENVTSLLDSLLDHYDAKLRPGGDQALSVTVDINIRSMGPVSEKNQEFALDCYFRQSWMDDRLKLIGSPLKTLVLASSMTKQIWMPDTYIRLTIRARCPMFLRKFPLDHQACPLVIGSLGYSKNDLLYVWNDVTVEQNIALAQYQLGEMHLSEQNITDIRGEDFDKLSVVAVFFKLRRTIGYYMIQVFLPSSLIVVLSWVNFWIDKSASPARVSLGVLTVLNMCTLGTGHRDYLPKVSYATALDIYIVCCFIFLFAATVEYVLINYLDCNVEEQDEAPKRKKRKIRRVKFAKQTTTRKSKSVGFEDANTLTSISSLESLLMMVIPRSANSCPSAMSRLTETSSASDDGKRHNCKIDDVSKFLFPTLFGLFNALFWILLLYVIPNEVDDINSFMNLDDSISK